MRRPRGLPRRDLNKRFTRLCVVCEHVIPQERFKVFTCSDICAKAYQTGKTRAEQAWIELTDAQ